ncbi:MAG: hypothetical protein M1832_004745 [Thelocarpon impressellum]|nr:MAG: hypothetical protein M1832_004745 [Thelocarpon impressellum]
MDVFFRSETKPFITVDACNEGIRFMLSHMLFVDARRLYLLMASLKLSRPTETYNIMLRASAGLGDLTNFNFILALMLRRGVPPNGATWTAFLMNELPREAREDAVQSMRGKGLLRSPYQVGQAAAQGVYHELSEWLDDGKSLNSFVGDMDRVYGDGWLTTSAANRLLSVLGQRAMLDESMELWEVARARHVSFDVISLTSILFHCRRMPATAIALKAIQAAERDGIKLNEVAYHALISMAWKLRLYNVARVGWRYACLEGAVAHKVKAIVVQTLQRVEPAVAVTSHGAWRKDAGKLMVGVDPDGGSSRLVQELQQSDLDGSEHDQVGKLARELMNKDLEAFLTLQPTVPLSQMLELALAKDDHWRSGQTVEQRPLVWKLQHAIHVPCSHKMARLKDKPRPSTKPPTNSPRRSGFRITVIPLREKAVTQEQDDQATGYEEPARPLPGREAFRITRIPSSDGGEGGGGEDRAATVAAAPGAE